MDNYIGVKLIKATPMLAEAAFQVLRKPMDLAHAEKDDTGFHPGYLVEYPDGYQSWSPAKQFEAAYLKVDPNPSLKTNCSISQKMVDNFFKDIEVITMGEKNTVVRATLVNGFEIVESSACVDPANYDENLGANICVNKIKDKVWFLLGFLLQTAVGGVK